jgi:hypothetical protein
MGNVVKNGVFHDTSLSKRAGQALDSRVEYATQQAKGSILVYIGIYQCQNFHVGLRFLFVRGLSSLLF